MCRDWRASGRGGVGTSLADRAVAKCGEKYVVVGRWVCEEVRALLVDRAVVDSLEEVPNLDLVLDGAPLRIHGFWLSSRRSDPMDLGFGSWWKDPEGLGLRA